MQALRRRISNAAQIQHTATQAYNAPTEMIVQNHSFPGNSPPGDSPPSEARDRVWNRFQRGRAKIVKRRTLAGPVKNTKTKIYVLLSHVDE